MARLVLIIILVLIVLAILLRRRQPPPLVEVHPLDAGNEDRPALHGGEQHQDRADLPAESGDGISENEKDR